MRTSLWEASPVSPSRYLCRSFPGSVSSHCAVMSAQGRELRPRLGSVKIITNNNRNNHIDQDTKTESQDVEKEPIALGPVDPGAKPHPVTNLYKKRKVAVFMSYVGFGYSVSPLMPVTVLGYELHLCKCDVFCLVCCHEFLHWFYHRHAFNKLDFVGVPPPRTALPPPITKSVIRGCNTTQDSRRSKASSFLPFTEPELLRTQTSIMERYSCISMFHY